MDKSVIFEKVRDVIVDTADISPDEVTMECAMMDDLDLSSMEVMTIVAELEDVFSLRIPENELRGFVTTGDLVEYLAARVG